MSPAQALIELKRHPRKWLERHHLLTYRGVPTTFSAQQHHFGNVDMSGLPGGNVPQRTSGTQTNYIVHTGKGTRTFVMTLTALAVQFAPVS